MGGIFAQNIIICMVLSTEILSLMCHIYLISVSNVPGNVLLIIRRIVPNSKSYS